MTVHSDTEWITLDPADKVVIAEIESQRDRGAALVAAAFVEERLTRTIKLRLREDPKVEKRLLRGIGPLRDFSSKIDLGYLLQLYANEVRELLHALREIRNEFAHTTQPLEFNSPATDKDSPGMDQRCGQLAALGSAAFIPSHSFIEFVKKHTRGPKGKLVATPGGHFSFGISAIPRVNFINATKLCLFFLALAHEAFANDRLPMPPPPPWQKKPEPPPVRAARSPNPHRKMRKLQRRSSKE